MTQLGTHHETEELGDGRFRHTQHLRRIAYRQDGSLHRIVNDFIDSGDGTRPHMVSAAPFLLTIAPDGMRRIHPTRELDRYFEIGPPYIYTGGAWNKVNLGAATRTSNRLMWQTANADVSITMAGHYVDFESELKNGWKPPTGRFAFPMGLTGLTRSGNQLLADGVPVMSFRAPHVYDAANPRDVRPITSDFVKVGSQWYALFTLPSLTGMSRPVVDPTLTLQPDATDGLDTLLSSYTLAEKSQNFGVTNLMSVGKIGGAAGEQLVRGLLQFDLSSVPANAVVSLGTLTLVRVGGGSDAAATISGHTSLVQWFEGSKNGAEPDAGQDGSTWNLRNANGAVAWLGGVGGGSGSDYAAVASASVAVLGDASYDMIVTTDVAAWINGSATNNGLWLIGDELVNLSFKQFASSDHATAANRPKLVVEYSLPAQSSFVRAPMWGRF